MTQAPLTEIAFRYLDSVAHKIKNPHLSAITYGAVCDPRFQQGFGSAERHHAFPGGLIVHTAEVTALALDMARSFGQVSFDVLATAAILHDFMKIHEYELGPLGEVIKTEYRKMVRHLAGSHAMFFASVAHLSEDDVPGSIRMRIEHAMLAHHGRLEWQTAVEPITPEAHILHYADMLSSRFGATSVDQPTDIIPIMMPGLS